MALNDCKYDAVFSFKAHFLVPYTFFNFRFIYEYVHVLFIFTALRLLYLYRFVFSVVFTSAFEDLHPDNISQ